VLGEPTFKTESRWAELNFSGHPDGNHKHGASEMLMISPNDAVKPEGGDKQHTINTEHTEWGAM
jgi:hypothetical protein